MCVYVLVRVRVGREMGARVHACVCASVRMWVFVCVRVGLSVCDVSVFYFFCFSFCCTPVIF